MQRSWKRLWGWTAVLGALAVGAGCGAEPEDEEPAQRSPDDSYRRTRHMRALDETVTLVKEGGGTYAIREDGRRQSLLDLEAEERAAKYARWGAVDPDFDAELRAASPAVQIPVAFHFDPKVDWARLTPELAHPDGKAAARASLQAAIAAGARKLEGELTAAGVASVWHRPTMPVVFGLASAPTIQGLARHASLTLIASNAPGRPRLHAGPPNTVTDPEIDVGMNALGYFGADQKIGFIEEAECGMYDPHEAFSENANPITYQVEPKDCNDDSDCFECDLGGGAMCLDLGHPGHDKQCVAVHVSQTGSSASATRGGSGNGASKASLYHPNRGDTSPIGFPSVACSAGGIVDAYDWLTGEGVTTANESWGCQPLGSSTAATLEGLAEDWYARNFGISIFKSAGNDPEGEACPFTLNSICVGGTNVDHELSCFTSWHNGTGDKETDREEPDITALAGDASEGCRIPLGQVDVMDVGDPTGWTGNDGTSFASPAMAGFAALLKEACGGNLDQKLVRVIMRNAAWPRNPDGWRYSTPKPGLDHKDGGGNPIAGAAVAFCHPTGPGPDNTSGENPGDLNDGDKGPDGDPPPDGPPPGEDKRRSSDAPGSSDGRLYNSFFQVDLRAGNRIRVSLAWDSCPASSSGTAPAAVATDYDLFLYNEDKAVYVYSSQSFDDSTEGFDVTVPEDGRYTVYYAWPDGSSGCSGSGFEPFAWAVTWWT
jgi:hypothetical protein